MFPVKRFLRPGLTMALGALLLLNGVSCGKKANPVIPVKILPNAVDPLSYRVKGKDLLVTWTIPNQNTDGSPLKDLKGFKVQKGDWPTRDFCATCPDNFQEKLWIDLKGPELPDVAIGSEEVRLTFNRLEPGHTYSFQVTAVTKGEVDSAPSKTLRVAWDLPLKAPSDLQINPKGSGLEITWSPVQALVDDSPAAGIAGYSLYRRLGKGTWSKINREPISGTTYLDEDLQEGVTYTYQVKALRKSSGQLLESEGSEERGLVFSRVTPPPQVQDLVVLPGPKGIEVRWEGIVSMTPSGYYVYKRTGNEKEPRKINQEPLKDTVFEDQQVAKGKTYYYSISAVGNAPALLEGPRSKEAEVVFNP